MQVEAHAPRYSHRFTKDTNVRLLSVYFCCAFIALRIKLPLRPRLNHERRFLMTRDTCQLSLISALVATLCLGGSSPIDEKCLIVLKHTWTFVMKEHGAA